MTKTTQKDNFYEKILLKDNLFISKQKKLKKTNK